MSTNVSNNKISSSRGLMRNTVFALVNQLAGLAIPIITLPYVSRVLGPEGLGRSTYAQAIAGTFATVGMLGIPLYAAREAPKLRDDSKAFAQFVFDMLGLSLVTNSIAVVAMLGFVFSAASSAEDYVLFGVASVPLLLAPLNLEYVFRAYENWEFVTVRNLVVRVILCAATFVFVRGPGDSIGYTLLLSLNSGCVFISNVLFVRRYVQLGGAVKNALSLRRHFGPVAKLSGVAFGIGAYMQLDSVLLGCLGGSVQLGMYNIASKFVLVGGAFVTVFSGVLMPRTSYYAAKMEAEYFSEIVHRGLAIAAIAGCFAASFCLFNATQLVALLGGSKYEGAAIVLRVLSAKIGLVGLSSTLGYQVLASMRMDKEFGIAVIAGGLVCAAFCAVFVSKLGAIGAAIGSVSAEVAVCSILSYFAVRANLVSPNRVSAPLYLGVALIGSYGAQAVVLSIGVTGVWSIIASLLLTAAMGGALLLFFRDRETIYIINTVRRKLCPRSSERFL